MRIIVLAGLLGLLLLAPAFAFAKTVIFACEPEWAALVKEIGGDKIEASAATTARQDPHHVRARPSLIAAMRRADLVICSGAGLEVGWLPILIEKAGKAVMQPGNTGYLLASDVVPMLEVPESLDRSQGDIHPEGNPHVHLNPHNIARVAEELKKRLVLLDSANARYYETRLKDFLGRWRRAVVQWEKRGAALHGMPIIVHHRAWAYLEDWLRLKEVAALEPKPGIPPAVSHLQSLLHAEARAIVRSPYDSGDASAWLAEKTGITAIVLPYTVGGDAESGDLFALFERTLTLLEQAHAGH